MTLDHAGIERCVPHAGSMVLLDAVLHWDATHIVCSAAAPNAGHPLARDGAVRAVTAAEYAAQAVAVHGALLEHQAALLTVQQQRSPRLLGLAMPFADGDHFLGPVRRGAQQCLGSA